MKSIIAGLRRVRRVAGLLALATSLGTAAGAQGFASDAPAQLGADAAGLVEYARLHNPAFAVERAEAAAARERAEPAGALPDPRFQLELMDFTNTMRGGGTSLVPGEVGQTRYRVIQPLPGWGKRELAARAADARADRAGAARDAAWLEVAAQIETAWLRYYAADREAALNRDALTLLASIEEITLSRYRLGLLPQQAVLRAQREITSQRLALVAVEQRRRSVAAALNALLARAPDSALATPRNPAPLPSTLPLAAFAERVRTANPLIAAEERGIEAARLDRDLTWRDRYPDFSLGLTNNRPRGGDASWDVMFEMTIPLQQSARRAREREAALAVNAADARRDAAEAQLLGALGTAHAAFTSGVDTLRLLRGTLIPQAEATRDATRAAFESGRVDFDSVLEAERQLVDTRVAMLRAEVDAHVALTEIEKLAGEMQ